MLHHAPYTIYEESISQTAVHYSTFDLSDIMINLGLKMQSYDRRNCAKEQLHCETLTLKRVLWICLNIVKDSSATKIEYKTMNERPPTLEQADQMIMSSAMYRLLLTHPVVLYVTLQPTSTE